MEISIKSLLIKGGLQENFGQPKTFDLHVQILLYLGYVMCNSYNEPSLVFINPEKRSGYDLVIMFHLYNNERC